MLARVLSSNTCGNLWMPVDAVQNKNGRVSASVVGAQQAVPGEHAWLRCAIATALEAEWFALIECVVQFPCYHPPRSKTGGTKYAMAQKRNRRLRKSMEYGPCSGLLVLRCCPHLALRARPKRLQNRSRRSRQIDHHSEPRL